LFWNTPGHSNCRNPRHVASSSGSTALQAWGQYSSNTGSFCTDGSGTIL
jgi:hypothetical protein